MFLLYFFISFLIDKKTKPNIKQLTAVSQNLQTPSVAVCDTETGAVVQFFRSYLSSLARV